MILLNFSHSLTPTHLRLRLVQDSIPPRYKVAEVLDLQTVRDGARRWR